MKKDQHVNTSMSKKSNSCMEDYIRNAYHREVDEITVVDEYNPSAKEPLNVHDYYFEYIRFIRNTITKINLGIDIILSDEFKEYVDSVLSHYNFDLVVGSTDSQENESVKDYLKRLLDNVTLYKDDIDVVSTRIDSVGGYETDLTRYQNIIDKILKVLIDNSIGIEVNSRIFEGSSEYTNIPSIQILKRYKELGGDIVTIGSYASSVEDLSLYFENVYNILENIGFNAISQFHKRVPEQIELKRLKEVVWKE